MLLIPILVICLFLIACALYFTRRYAKHILNQGTRRLFVVFLTTLFSMAFVFVVFSVFLMSFIFNVLNFWPSNPIDHGPLTLSAVPAIALPIAAFVSWLAGSRVVRAFERRAQPARL